MKKYEDENKCDRLINIKVMKFIKFLLEAKE